MWLPRFLDSIPSSLAVNSLGYFTCKTAPVAACQTMASSICGTSSTMPRTTKAVASIRIPGSRRRFAKMTAHNFGPQIGFAWSPSRFKDRLAVRGGYGLNYNQEEIAISANISNNPGLVVFPFLGMATPTSTNPGIIYATSANVHSLFQYPANP